MQVVITNESSEFLSYFPHYKWLFNDSKRRYDQLCTELVHLMQANSYKSKTNPDKIILVDRMKKAGVRSELDNIREWLASLTLIEFESLLPPPNEQISGTKNDKHK